MCVCMYTCRKHKGRRNSIASTACIDISPSEDAKISELESDLLLGGLAFPILLLVSVQYRFHHEAGLRDSVETS